MSKIMLQHVQAKGLHFSSHLLIICPLVTELSLPKQALVFMCLQYMSFENTVGKGEIACNEQFLLFP